MKFQYSQWYDQFIEISCKFSIKVYFAKKRYVNKGDDVSVYSHDIDPSVFDGVSKEELIEFNKIMSQLTKRAEANINRDTCFLCGQKKRLINSHSIPEQILNNISQNGCVDTIAALLKIPKLEKSHGVNKSGTFRLLCQDCDNKTFADYENFNNFPSKPNGTFLAEIALKTYLKELNKKMLEVPQWRDQEFRELIFPDNLNEKTDPLIRTIIYESKIGSMNNLLNRAAQDEKLYKADIEYAKKYLGTHGKSNGYFLHYYKQLNYVCPIAFQGRVTLWGGFDDEMVNCINDKERYSDLHICVFPMRDHTKVFLFTKNNDKTLRRFIKSFNRLNPEDQLRTICYIIFVYSEEIYMHPELKNKLSEISSVRDAITSIGQTIHTGFVTNIEQTIALIRRNSLTKRHTFPNLLSEEYKINI